MLATLLYPFAGAEDPMFSWLRFVDVTFNITQSLYLSFLGFVLKVVRRK